MLRHNKGDAVSNVKITSAELADIGKVLILGKRFFHCSGFDHFYDWHEPSVKQLLENLVTSTEGALLVAKADGFIIGMIGVHMGPVVLNQTKLLADELFMWVEDNERQVGVGADLLEAALNWASMRKADMISFTSLEALAPARVGKLYEGYGFKPVSRMYLKRI